MQYTDYTKLRSGVLTGAGSVRLSVALLMGAAFAFPVSALFGSYAPVLRDALVAACSLLSFLFSFGERRGWGGPFVVCFVLFSVYSLVSVFWIPNFSAAYIRLVDLALAVLLGAAVAANGPRLREAHLILDAFLVGTILVSLVSLWIDRATLSGWTRLGRVLFESAGSNIIEYSCILIYAQMYAAYRLFSSKRWVRWGVAFCLLFVCGLLTGIRKAFIVPLVFVYVYSLIRNRNKVLKIMGVSVLVVALTGLLLVIVSQSFTSLGTRLTSLFNDILSGAEAVSSGGNSYEERMWLRQTAWQAFTENPVLGLGVGQFRSYSVAHGGPDVYAHNNYLELLANSGIVGFVLYYGAIASLIRAFWRALSSGDERLSRFCTFSVAFIVSILVMEYGQVDYYQSYYLLFPFLMSAFIQSPEVGKTARCLELAGKERFQ